MSGGLTFPGFFGEEVPGGVPTITGVATSIAAFVGFAKRGPVDEPTLVWSFGDFGRLFGGLWAKSTMSYAVQQYFQNGGRVALVVRGVHRKGIDAARNGRVTVGSGKGALTLEAADPGVWSEDLRVRIDHDTEDRGAALFNLSIKDESTGVVETLRGLAADGSLAALVARRSSLVRAVGTLPTVQPDHHAAVAPRADPFDPAQPNRYTAFPATGADSGEDGTRAEADLVPAADDGTGLYALARADLFNLVCVPPFLPASDTGPGRVLSADSKAKAAAFCVRERALLVVDPHPDWTTAAQIAGGGTALGTYLRGMASSDKRNAALYFPYIKAPDPLQGNTVVDFPPCGAVAGVIARTDASSGVWKAPAGLEAGLSGVQALKASLTDAHNSVVNALGVNCLRTFPDAGSVVWGARTLQGADGVASEWKYVPVRRTALFLEESLYRGTQWAVFEPNEAPLWAQIRLTVGAFLHGLFAAGAFAGATPSEAYFVKCGAETTTQDDINHGIVNSLVGFASLKPAEFVVISLQQKAGQTGAGPSL